MPYNHIVSSSCDMLCSYVMVKTHNISENRNIKNVYDKVHSNNMQKNHNNKHCKIRMTGYIIDYTPPYLYQHKEVNFIRKSPQNLALQKIIVKNELLLMGDNIADNVIKNANYRAVLNSEERKYSLSLSRSKAISNYKNICDYVLKNIKENRVRNKAQKSSEYNTFYFGRKNIIRIITDKTEETEESEGHALKKTMQYTKTNRQTFKRLSQTDRVNRQVNFQNIIMPNKGISTIYKEGNTCKNDILYMPVNETVFGFNKTYEINKRYAKRMTRYHTENKTEFFNKNVTAKETGTNVYGIEIPRSYVHTIKLKHNNKKIENSVLQKSHSNTEISPQKFFMHHNMANMDIKSTSPKAAAEKYQGADIERVQNKSVEKLIYCVSPNSASMVLHKASHSHSGELKVNQETAGQSTYREIQSTQGIQDIKNMQNTGDMQSSRNIIQNIQSTHNIQSMHGTHNIQSIHDTQSIQNTQNQSTQVKLINRTESMEDILRRQEKSDEINKLIDIRLQRQIKNISKHIYDTLERKLQQEKRRRGF